MNMRQWKSIGLLFLVFNTSLWGQNNRHEDTIQWPFYNKMLELPWQEVFYDSFEKNWNDKWFLDGLHASIKNGPQGMDFYAGPVAGQDSEHTVLWTRQSFCGDLRIEYNYMKLDTMCKYVTILYLLAEGSGIAPYEKDIFKWRHLRENPAMKLYFEHMNAYHISYAAFENDNQDKQNDYIRVRRYLPERGKGLSGTDVKPDFSHTSLFDTGVLYHITIICRRSDIFMHIKNDKLEKLYHWQTGTFPLLVSGRIGLRHMCTRAARYQNFKIWTLL